MPVMNKVARYVQLKRISSIPDSELIVSGVQQTLPDYHWCKGCQWGTHLGDRYMCPFVMGSCARIPWSMEHPDPEMLIKRIRYDHDYEMAKANGTLKEDMR